ncbi:POTRA domain-containing protein [Lysobacter capsici]|uniref:POTRA domain-containing protein n=1 Tax=Lysobacter capsici TaxID=435897 RepID=UPI00398D3C4B
MTQNVRVSLSLVDTIGKDVSGRRLGYLLREAENEAREALEPFGYYSPTIKVEDSRGTRRIATSEGTDPNAPAEGDRSAADAGAAADTGADTRSAGNAPPATATRIGPRPRPSMRPRKPRRRAPRRRRSP